MTSATTPPAIRPGRVLGISPSLSRKFRGLLGIAILLGAWQASVPLVGVESFLYPSPLQVWDAFIDLMAKGILQSYLLDSLARYAMGVGAGLVLGVVLGILIGVNATASRVLGPFINFMFAIVEVAWLPIFVVWWGYGLKTILMVLAYVAFFPILYNTMTGIRTVPAVMVNAVRSLGANQWHVLTSVLIPAALPNIITGFRVGAGFAFRGLIFAEIIAAKTGIGHLIFEGVANQQTARTVVGMFVIGMTWLFIDNVYIRPFEKVTIERWGSVTSAEERE